MSIFDEIDLSPMPADQVRKIRESYDLTDRDMAALVGVSHSTWRIWEFRGAPAQWAFLIREWEDEAIEDISSTTCSADTLRALRSTLGEDETLQDALGVSRSALTSWLSRGVPGLKGWGRAIEVISSLAGVNTHPISRDDRDQLREVSR